MEFFQLKLKVPRTMKNVKTHSLPEPPQVENHKSYSESHVHKKREKSKSSIYRALYSPWGHFLALFLILRRLFQAPRRFLGAIKIATESWESILSDSKVWSTGADLLARREIHYLDLDQGGKKRAVFSPLNTFLPIFSWIRILISRFFYERKVRG